MLIKRLLGLPQLLAPNCISIDFKAPVHQRKACDFSRFPLFPLDTSKTCEGKVSSFAHLDHSSRDLAACTRATRGRAGHSLSRRGLAVVSLLLCWHVAFLVSTGGTSPWQHHIAFSFTEMISLHLLRSVFLLFINFWHLKASTLLRNVSEPTLNLSQRRS